MTRTRRDSRKRWLRVLAAVCLTAALILFLWNRNGADNAVLPRYDRLAEKSQRYHSSADLSAPVEPIAHTPPPARQPQPLQAEKSPAAAPSHDYESEAFSHVPAWMPRPANVLSARAEDASLRSDGLVEGNLKYVFRADHANALDEITAQLEAAGMSADAAGKVFSSQDPPRRCEVRVETAPNGGMMISLFYQGIDHEKGCLCPTCGMAPESSNP